MKNLNPYKNTFLAKLFGKITMGVIFLLVINTSMANNETNNIYVSSVRYITDSLEVPLRRGPNYKYKIEKVLKSGQKVQIQEVSDNGWVRIEFKGKSTTYTGWVPAVLLQNEPIERTKLKQQISKNNSLIKKNNQLNNDIKEINSRYQKISDESKQFQQEKLMLSRELQELKKISGDTVSLYEKNKNLQQQLKQLQTKITIYEEQSSNTEENLKRQWFITGAGVLVIGILLGVFLRLPKRNKTWGSLERL